MSHRGSRTRVRKLNDQASQLVVEVADILQDLPVSERSRFAVRLVQMIWHLSRHDRRAEMWHAHFEHLGWLRDEAQELKDSLERKATNA